MVGPSEPSKVEALLTCGVESSTDALISASVRGAEVQGGTRRRLILYHPNDHEYFTDLICLVRKQIEIFVQPTKKKKTDASRNCNDASRHLYAEGKVGIRCVHCAPPKPTGAEGGTASAPIPPPPERGAAVYPNSTSLVYQSVRNWQRHHMLSCPLIPEEVREELVALKSAPRQRRSSNSGSSYWESSCARLGLVDTRGGLKLRKGALDGTWAYGADDGNGKEDMAQLLEPSKAPPLSPSKSEPRCALSPPVVLDNLPRVRPLSDMQSITQTKICPGNEAPCVSVFGSVSILPADSITTKQRQPSHMNSSDIAHATLRTDIDISSLTDASASNTNPVGLGVRASVEGGICDEFDSKPLHESLDIHWDGNVDLDRTNTIRNDKNGDVGGYNHTLGSGSQTALELTTAQMPIPDQNQLTNSGTLPRDVIMERLGLAWKVVQAAVEIRRLPPQDNTIDHAATDIEFTEDIFSLRALGKELYELLLNKPTFGVGVLGGDSTGAITSSASGSGDSDEPSLTRHEKKAQRTVGSSNHVVHLEALGYPSALCFLLTALLDATSGGGTETCSIYSTFKEVEEDLNLMVNQPENFLFDSSGAVDGSELLQLNNPEGELYGREEEMSKLHQAFEQAFSSTDKDHKNGVVLISGYSGTGKSSLVLKAKARYIQRGARFISGKFDAMRQVQPLSAIMSALNDYCNLLANDANQIDQIREALAINMGTEGWALADLIPNLRMILPNASDGQQSAHVSGKEAQQRLEFLIRMLFRATCSGQSQPVVLFLDDLQWANEQSLNIMTALATDSQQTGLLIIGCYRDNEVGPESVLTQYVDRLQRSESVAINSIHIDNLGLESVNALISGAIRAFPRATRPLARVVLNNTGGNTFFVKQLLHSLFDEGLLRYSLPTRKWEWDLDSIRNREIASNVVEHMAAKLLRLAPEVHKSLRIVAAFGSHCQEDVLRIIDTDPSRLGCTVTALDVAVEEGLVVKTGGATYRFAHDQIQNAAYNLIPQSERDLFHLQIGRSLWQQSSAKQIDKYMFVLVDQLHRGAGLVSDQKEKIRFAELSLVAGQKAASMSAFLPAWAYVKSGISLTTEDEWKCHRELCLNLYALCAEMEYIHGNFDAMAGSLEVIIKRGNTLQEKIRAYYLLVQSSGTQRNSSDAFATAITILGQLGEPLLSDVSESQTQRELVKTQALLRAKTDAEIGGLHPMEDSEKREAMKFYDILLLYAYTTKKDFFTIMACRMVQLSLSYGVCAESAVAFASFGMALCGTVSNIACGYRMGKVALAILDRFQAKESLARVYVSVYGFIFTWVQPLQSCIERHKHAIEVGLLTGDNEFAMLNVNMYQGTALASGQRLGTLMKDMKAYSKQMVELNQKMIYTFGKPMRQAVENLLGRSANPARLVGNELDERMLQRTIEEEGLSSMIRFYEMWLLYLFGNYEEAAEVAAKNHGVESQWLARSPIACNHVFYSGLTSLAMERKERCGRWMNTIHRTMNQMRGWTSSSPWNFQHKMELMIAECAFLGGDMSAAAEAYDSAIATAAKHRFIHEQGLALERAGIFYLESCDHAAASDRFMKAYDCYIQWEAFSKAAHLKEQYVSYIEH
uniref:Orc1-like AAA ATPase domain-containing protein n=1 Tax=Odontella aurita TaxID=265563 RepID=A0A7S4JZ20_9STRA|mmetsp:Transcript_57639/g.171954  ORF Transcript_57639/g.171954 Transcript_57639/m.171954 type:complete len:1594 (+) Transcript_57639:76-4857(+)